MSLEHMLRDEEEAWSFLLREEFEMELEEIEQEIEKRLGKLQTRRAESEEFEMELEEIEQEFEIPSWGEWLECYNALAQVKQAIYLASLASSLDSIAHELDAIRRNGLPVENIH